MRLIDADALEKKFHELALDEWNQQCSPISWSYAFLECEDRVFYTPTVDAVEVVRCRDCKWWKTNYSWNGNEHKICVREPYEPFRNAEDFCSYGERREDD